MENDLTKLKVNLDELSEKYIFKYSFFDNFDMSNILPNDALPIELKNENNDIE